jgi:hypothetical protein
VTRRILTLVGAVALVAVACRAVPGDVTGDRKADALSVDRADGTWHRIGSPAVLFTGQPTDVIVPGDYDGDGTWEPAVLRGTHWISAKAGDVDYAPRLPSGPVGMPSGFPNGLGPTPVIPVPADYDGDGKTDPAYYSQVNGTWWIKGQQGKIAFGIAPKDGGTMAYDVPVPADYDGDGKADIAIYRPTDSTFRIRSTGQVIQIGEVGDVPVPADYDGDGKADPAVYRINGEWLIAGHASPIVVAPSDPNYSEPVPADYDGDGKVDPAVIQRSTGAWIVSGQGTIGSISPDYLQTDAILPAYSLLNIVRLTFARNCAVPGHPDQPCPPHP